MGLHIWALLGHVMKEGSQEQRDNTTFKSRGAFFIPLSQFTCLA